MVKVECWLHTDGRASNIVLSQPSGNGALDHAAMSALAGAASGASPFDSFPYGLSVDRVKVRFTFIYNHGAAPNPLSEPTVIR
jgi:TonB family protein